MPTPKSAATASLLSVLDRQGFPDLVILNRLRQEGCPPKILAGEYRISDFLNAGFCLYGMTRVLKQSAYRKLGDHPLPFRIEDDAIVFDTYYVLNNSDIDPYLARVECRATLDHITFTYGDGLLIARFERSFVREAFDTRYRDRWVATMELRIARRDTTERYPYSLYRTLQVMRRNIERREEQFQRANPAYQLEQADRLPSDTEIAALSPFLTTPSEMGEMFYRLLSRDLLSRDELETMVNRIGELYRKALPAA